MLLQAKELLLNTKGAKEYYESMVEDILKTLSGNGMEITEEIENKAREGVLRIMFYTAIQEVKNGGAYGI